MMTTMEKEENPRDKSYQKVRVILNPITGKRNKQKWLKTIKEQYPQARIIPTEHAGHAKQIAERSTTEDDGLWVVIGGDGTVNELINGFENEIPALMILPGGSGNGFARHLNKLKKQGINEIRADAGQLDDQNFINLAGTGFDARLAYHYGKLKIRGFPAYALAFLVALFRHRPCHYEIKTDTEEYHLRAYMITLANGSQFGFGTRIAPRARIDDGYLDLVIIRNFPLFMAPLLLILSFTGGISRSKYILHQRISHATIFCPESMHVHMDGEYLGKKKEIFVRVRAGQVPIVL